MLELLRILRDIVLSIGAGALVCSLGLVLEAFFYDPGMALLAIVPFAVMTFLIGFAIGTPLAITTLLIMRGIQWRWNTLGRVVGVGAGLGLLAYLLLAAYGLGAPSDRPMTFAENILQPVHRVRGLIAASGGVAASYVFWQLSENRLSSILPRR